MSASEPEQVIDEDEEDMSAYFDEVNNQLIAGDPDDVESLGTIFRKVEVLEKAIQKFTDGSMLKYLERKISSGMQDLAPLVEP